MAVYTQINDDDLSIFLSKYDVGDLLLYKGIAEGVENTNYIIQTTEGLFVLTLYEGRINQADLPFFLTLMEHLASSGISCPTPVRDTCGNRLNQLSGRTAALVTFLRGTCITNPSPDHCYSVGRALACLHETGQSFPQIRPNPLGPSGWRILFEKISARVDKIDAGLSHLIGQELDALEVGWPTDLPKGTIHADLFPDNVFFLDNELSGMIDFYFACTDCLAYDIAICLNAWCFNTHCTFDPEKGLSLLLGYQEIRPLQESEMRLLPQLSRGAALRFLLTRCHDWLNQKKSAVGSPHDPHEYIQRLYFHKHVKCFSDYTCK